MSIALIVTGGFANGTLTTTIGNITARGFLAGAVVPSASGIFVAVDDARPYAKLVDARQYANLVDARPFEKLIDQRPFVALDDLRPMIKVQYDN